MRIAVGSDHAGFEIKESLKEKLRRGGHDVLDLGTDSGERVDYPEYAARVGRAVESGEAERGVLICGSGIGMCMGANRFPGVRAAVLHDEYDAEMSRLHNDANVACFGARKMDADRAGELVEIFLKTRFEGGRHEARVKKLDEISS
jgi:ribose 5-phosphate isomerase B